MAKHTHYTQHTQYTYYTHYEYNKKPKNWGVENGKQGGRKWQNLFHFKIDIKKSLIFQGFFKRW